MGNCTGKGPGADEGLVRRPRGSMGRDKKRQSLEEVGERSRATSSRTCGPLPRMLQPHAQREARVRECAVETLRRS